MQCERYQHLNHVKRLGLPSSDWRGARPQKYPPSERRVLIMCRGKITQNSICPPAPTVLSLQWRKC